MCVRQDLLKIKLSKKTHSMVTMSEYINLWYLLLQDFNLNALSQFTEDTCKKKCHASARGIRTN